jgi:ABC-2 type transport system permease protein
MREPVMTKPRPASVLDLYGPKWRIARRRIAEGASVGRTLVLGLVGTVFWAAVFALVWRLLHYFRATPGIGDLLALKLLGLVLLALFAILLLSNIITSLSSFFLARDLELLAAAPVDAVRLYAARLLETAIHSSWMVVLMLVPILSAYAVAFGATPLFGAVTLVALPAFITIPAVLGTAVTQVLVNVFPARRARDLLALVALLGMAAVVLLFRMLQPERLARPEGFRSLVDFVAALDTPQSAWLPSEWAAQAILAPLGVGGSVDPFPALLLLSTAAALFVLGAWLHGRLYAEGLSRSQEGAEGRDGAEARRRRLEPLLAGVPLTARTLIAKDVRAFFRDTTQWSQLILLAVLVVVYIYNIRVLPLFSGEEVGFFLVNVIAFLNLGLAGFVLAAIAARFLFPAVSLEGRTLWLLRSSPLRLSALVWSKFWVGVVPLLALALALTLGTNLMLRVGGFMLALSLVIIGMITFALAAMALGFGAVFPKFNTENAAEIPTGFGGLLFMMTAVAYLAVVVVLVARPVYSILRVGVQGGTPGPGHWVGLGVGAGLALAVSATATTWSLRVALRRIEALEP